MSINPIQQQPESCTMINFLKLSEALSSRLCHEFAGSIGAITNCVSLLENKEYHIKTKALELMTLNTNILVSRLRFYRYAYGITAEEELLDIKDFITIIIEFLEETKITVKLVQMNNNPLEAIVGKIILCIIVLVVSILSKGGIVEIIVHKIKSHYKVFFTLRGQEIVWDESKTVPLTEILDARQINIKNVNECYIHYLCEQKGYKIKINQFPGVLELALER